ncbi:MAG: hypothetical protein A2167_02795 [Planctomycetes bacterium RBG_13_46_10]|nr:MAG: hypothetical protein A2167_02795 [Planctomycetes bacterium RBG_13_46_10]
MDVTENNDNADNVTQKPTPTVLSINICDNIIRDEITKKVSLIGLFSAIRANNFPCTHPLLHVHVALTNGHGKYQTDIRFLNLADDKPIAGMRGPLLFQNPLQVVELNVCWQQLRFEKPGEYVVQVICDGVPIGERKFIVIGPQQDMPPTSGTDAK